MGRLSSTGLAIRRLLRDGVAGDAPELDEQQRLVSGHLVRLVQILFGVVAGQSLVLYRDVVTSPLHHERLVAALALLSIYLMIVWSWIDWNITMEAMPYDFRPHPGVRGGRFIEHAERSRLYSDIAIVTIYAYLLFEVRPLVDHPEADLRYLLIGYPAVFLLYLASGVLRIVRHGASASNIPPIVLYLAAFAVIFVWYEAFRVVLPDYALNCVTVIATTVVTRSYRAYRRRWKARHG